MANEGFAGGAGVVTNATGQDPNSLKLTFSRGSIKYDNPFLDMTSTYLPARIKSILRFVAVYALGDGLVSQCIIKMAEYPITKLIYNDEEESKFENDKTIEFWKKILEDVIKINRVKKEAGMDYYAYGNSLISIDFPFQRQLFCPKCKDWHNVKAYKGVKFRAYKFYATCKCKYTGPMEARDLGTKEINRVKVVLWDLLNIDIKYNSISGDHFYYYTIPVYLKNAIRRGDMDIVSTTRLEVIEAVKKNKQLKLMKDNLFHLKRCAPQYIIPSERGWGIPIIMPIMKDIFHNKILKKGNEMIAFDHIVPLRLLFPQGTGDVSPHVTMNLGNWKSRIEEEILKWRRDQNYISIVPIPVGMSNFGGDAKILMVTPEIKVTEDNIIIGIGIIPEIIRGGASWSGSNVSLRVVENTFINHRDDMQRLDNFIIDKISVYFGKPKIDVKMSDFKMADDLQKKQLMVDAAIKGSPSDTLISRTTATKELGFDPQKEYENKQEEIKKILEMKTTEAEGLAEANGAGSIINALYGADAQMEGQRRMEMHQKEMDQERQDEVEAEKQQNADAVKQESGKVSDGQPMNLQHLIYLLTARFARLAKIDRDEFKIRMLGMKQSMPNMFQEVYRNLQEMNLIEADLIPNLETIEKYTPGTVPQNIQGETTAVDQPSPAESGLEASKINEGATSKQNPLPEQRPPRSVKSSV